MGRSSIIIPVFNLPAITDRCLNTVKQAGAGEVIVVDDGSADDTPRMLASHAGSARVIRHERNLGFARSCNEGAAAAKGEFLVFLNNDTIAHPGWLAALEKHADAHPRAAVVGCRLLYPDGTIQHAGVVIGQDGYPRHLYTGFPGDHPAASKSRRFRIVTAACALIRRSAFEEAGGFDESFRNGFEDVDLCLRLGEMGHEVHYCAEAVVTHLESVSPGRFQSRRENVDLYRDRWMSCVPPDDLAYYVEDGLLRISYEGRYPVGLEVSPLLATVDAGDRTADVERLLREKSRQIADLQRENTRLQLDLGAAAADSPELRYRRQRENARGVVEKRTPDGSVVLVVSNGDGALLDMRGRTGWHFPRTDTGAYAGHHPRDSRAASAHLDELRARGARYLLIPPPSLWWLDHYAEFGRRLQSEFVRIDEPEDGCALFLLDRRPGDGT